MWTELKKARKLKYLFEKKSLLFQNDVNKKNLNEIVHFTKVNDTISLIS
jgi:hypothetical protein